MKQNRSMAVFGTEQRVQREPAVTEQRDWASVNTSPARPVKSAFLRLTWGRVAGPTLDDSHPGASVIPQGFPRLPLTTLHSRRPSCPGTRFQEHRGAGGLAEPKLPSPVTGRTSHRKTV